MHYAIQCIAASALLVCTASAFAVNRCEANGRVTYQHGPCNAGTTSRTVDVRPANPTHRPHYGGNAYRQPSYGQESWRYRSPAVNPYTSRNGPCPSGLEIQNAETSASSIALTPYEKARQLDNVRMMKACR